MIARSLALLVVLASLGPSSAALQAQATDEHAGHVDHAAQADHAQHDHGAGQAAPAATPDPPDPHAGHHHEAAPATDPPGAEPLPPFIPPLTDADRRAAFPDVHAHAAHDRRINSLVLFDHLEWQAGDGPRQVSWDTNGWIGGDLDRVWFRSEGEAESGNLDHAEAHLLYGRAIARWWDVVAGMRQDVRPGSPQTWGAFGIQGLAPYWFEITATAYVGPSARTGLRLAAEYELLLTNRLILRPLVSADLYGKADDERALGAGLSSMDAGVRVRYEFRREVAPYVGVTWHRLFAGTADRARSVADGGGPGAVRLTTGLRLWF